MHAGIEIVNRFNWYQSQNIKIGTLRHTNVFFYASRHNNFYNAYIWIKNVYDSPFLLNYFAFCLLVKAWTTKQYCLVVRG